MKERKVIAAMALQGILSAQKDGTFEPSHCDKAVQYADELLRLLNETQAESEPTIIQEQ